MEKPLRKQSDYVKVEFLEDVEEFIGIDLKKFGPYNKGDMALIPKDNAELFIKAGKAMMVSE
jgi:DNA replication factor GINS